MVWSNWQGAIWRGAGLMMLFWSGLAWTQTPAPRAGDSPEPTMVVHENGKATRCRVLETWQLPDGRRAHLLEAIETGDKITIVSEPTSGAAMPSNPKAMAIRIFARGAGRRTPPEGSPLPPHLRQDSGLVIKNESPIPAGAVAADSQNPLIINRPDDSALGAKYANSGPRIIEGAPTLRSGGPLMSRIFPRRKEMSTLDPTQVIEYPALAQAPAANPLLLPAAPLTQAQGSGSPQIVNGSGNVPTLPAPPSARGLPKDATLPPPPGLPTQAPPLNTPEPAKPVIEPAPAKFTPTLVTEPCQVVQEKRSWRPGDRLAAWWQAKSAKPDMSATAIVPADPVVINAPRTGDQKIQKADEYLTQENKVADKKLKEKVENIYKMPFSTAMNTAMPPSNPPEVKKPEPMPLAISGSKPATRDEKPAIAPPAPPMPLAKDELKPTNVAMEEKRDMFGQTTSDKVALPGKSVLDTPPVKADLVKLPPPPTPRRDDPLLAPDRLPTANKARVLPPVAREVTPAPANSWPLGAQSVLAARSGLEGPVTYVPVPTVTVPQPNHPPTPPPPAMPDAPQLNAYVNAFTPPPQPKGAQQMPPQGMMPAQAMMPYGNPMMQQMPYGYPPMNAYGQPMMPSQGPMANYSRQYAGPMPPANPFAAPTMPAGYGYPMMPQQPLQQVAYQQQMPAPAGMAQQIEQLIKVMRENAYPAQREWAAQMLASYDWRIHPQIVPALLQSAAQDPAASVRGGCVNCLGRMQAAVEPVLATLHAMRSDIDPRVRSEVEQAFVRLGQTPMAPQ